MPATRSQQKTPQGLAYLTITFATMARVCLLLLVAPMEARWCQVENVKADIHGNYSYMGPWRIDGCTTLSLDHGYCAEMDCPWRVKFGDEEIIELADKLHGNTALTALSLNSNTITNEGAMAIAEALRDNEVLCDLNLGGNNISDAGASALADILATNGVFTNLNLEHNQISEAGGRVLVNLLKSTESALDTLHIGNNEVSPELVAEAEEANKAAFIPPDSAAASGTPALGDGKDEM